MRTAARSPSTVLSALAIVTLGLGAGCRTPPPVYVVEAEPEAICVPEAPPAPRLEVPPAPPDESSVWQPGYWHWDGGGYDWVGGYWVEPRLGYFYVEASYVYVDGTWRYRPPYWRHHRHHRHHRGRPGHGGPPDAVAMPAPPVRDGSAGTTPHRAPPAPDGPTVHRAPPAPDGPTVHRAPPAPDLPDPDATAALPDPLAPEPPQVVRLPDEAVVDLDRESEPEAVRANIVRPERAYRHLPEYRGVRDGRLVFEQQETPGFRTDPTGAIVLAAEAERRWPRRRGFVVHRPEPRPALEHPVHPHVPVVGGPEPGPRPMGPRFVERPPLRPRFERPPPRVIHVPPPAREMHHRPPAPPPRMHHPSAPPPRMHHPSAPPPRMHRPSAPPPRMHRPAPAPPRMHAAPRRSARR